MMDCLARTRARAGRQACTEGGGRWKGRVEGSSAAHALVGRRGTMFVKMIGRLGVG